MPVGVYERKMPPVASCHAEALLSLGEYRLYHGKACPKGHTIRMIHDDKCLMCRRERSARYRARKGIGRRDIHSIWIAKSGSESASC